MMCIVRMEGIVTMSGLRTRERPTYIPTVTYFTTVGTRRKIASENAKKKFAEYGTPTAQAISDATTRATSRISNALLSGSNQSNKDASDHTRVSLKVPDKKKDKK